ncbi:DUF421 domain-containing protein [Erythrobacter sp.]|uniref:DUF421 domain-containing protein n=1 Tax=Erythrobacter sp. TaxID=1042 RepID=UPI002EA3B2BB|nr:YetF domain-containing protein [Erythrobacter sp.]
MEQTNEIMGWFGGMDRLSNVAIGAVFFYVYIVLLVRILGKRTTSQMNNFDWIITIAVGSLAASGVLLRNVAIAEAAAAIAILAAAQWLTTKLVLKSDLASKLVKEEPTMLTHKGDFLRDAMKRTRVSEEEVMGALRAEGLFNVEDANWVILETNGEFSVIPREDIAASDACVLEGVSKPDKLD